MKTRTIWLLTAGIALLLAFTACSTDDIPEEILGTYTGHMLWTQVNSTNNGMYTDTLGYYMADLSKVRYKKLYSLKFTRIDIYHTESGFERFFTFENNRFTSSEKLDYPPHLEIMDGRLRYYQEGGKVPSGTSFTGLKTD